MKHLHDDFPLRLNSEDRLSLFVFILVFAISNLMFPLKNLYAQGANAFGPSLGQSQNSQSEKSSSADKKSSKEQKKSSNPSQEENFALESSDEFEDAPLDLPTQNESGDEFFTSDSQSNTPQNPLKSGSSKSAFGNSSPPQELTPNVKPASQGVNSSPALENPSFALPNANPTPQLESSVPSGSSIDASQPINAPPPSMPSQTPSPTPSPQPLLQTAPSPHESGSQTELKVIIPDPSTLGEPIGNDFSGAPPVPGTMRQMADGEAPETYIVQRGDTLFDICDQLLDEKSYWPKLWSMNPYIRNPHFIFPTMKLRFYPGDDETPPYLEVVSEDDVIPVDKGNLNESELVADSVPPPQDSGDAIQAQTGPYIIEVIGPDQLADELSDAFMEAGARFLNTESSVEVPGFIFGEEKEPKAYILGGRYGEISLAPGQDATLESTENLESGSLLTVLRKSKKIYNTESSDFVGYLYYFVGNVLVTDQIEEDIYSGIVQSTRLTVKPDDIVVDFISTLRSVPLDTISVPKSDIDSGVVAFEFENQMLGAQGQTIFLDKGSKDGVSPGMYLNVYQTPKNLSIDIKNLDLPINYRQVGLIRIIDVTPEGSVGYILESSKEITLEDRTRIPTES